MPMPMYMHSQFHTGYAVRNADRAIASLRENMGITEWKIVRLPDDAPGHALAFAWAGNMMLELIDVKPGGVAIYDDWIPDDPGTLKVHHHGYYASDRAEFDALARDYQDKGQKMVIDAQMPGILYYRYFDTVALLGHYTEFVLLQDGGEAFFADVPRN